MHLNVEVTKQPEIPNQRVEIKLEVGEKSPAERSAIDPELVKTERRKKATLFLDQMKRDRVTGTNKLYYYFDQKLKQLSRKYQLFCACQGKSAIEDADPVGIESTSSSTKNSKSCSPDDVEIIGAVSGEARERSRRCVFSFLTACKTWIKTNVYCIAVPCLALHPKVGRKENGEMFVVVVGHAVEAEHDIEA